MMPSRLLLCCVCCALLLTLPVHAQITVEITRGNDNATSLAVVPFAHDAGVALSDTAEIIAANLRRSGRFNPLNRDSMLSLPSTDSEIVYTEWRQLKVEYLVVGNVTDTGNLLRLRYTLHSVARTSVIDRGELYTNPDEIRRNAHRLSDAIYQKLTGVRGVFDTRIAYTLEQRTSPRYALHVADADGGNDKVLLRSAHPILSPQWSPDAKELAYVSFEPGHPSVYRYNFSQQSATPLLQDTEYSSAPAFSPDGRSIAVVLARENNVDIYLFTLEGKMIRRVTRHFAIDTEPNFSADGKSLLFTSDRGGSPQVYRVAVRGGTPTRLTQLGNYNARPISMPDGSGMLVVHGSKGDYHIARQSFVSAEVNVLSDTMLDESPTVAPNGHMLMYAANHRARGVMVVVSIPSGAAARLQSRNGEIADPAWSPFLN